MIQKIN